MAKEKAQGTEVVNPQPSQELEVPKARVLAEVFAPNGKIRVELLPEGAGGSAEGGRVGLRCAPLISDGLELWHNPLYQNTKESLS